MKERLGHVVEVSGRKAEERVHLEARDLFDDEAVVWFSKSVNVSPPQRIQ